MMQEPHRHDVLSGTPGQPQQLLIQKLFALSVREQSRMLFLTTQDLPYKSKAAIAGVGGKQFFQKRFLPLAIHLLYTHFIKGIIWSVISLILAIFCLIILASLIQSNPAAITPVLCSTIAYFVGFFLSAFIRVWQEIHHLIRRTVTQAEYNHLLNVIRNLNESDKIVVLRALSAETSRFGAQGSFLSPFLSEIALLVGAGLMAGLILLLTIVSLPAALPASFFLLIAILVGFLLGFFIRSILHRSVTAIFPPRSHKHTTAE